MKRLKRRKTSTLSMTPMIDCVFLLLIFFMVSTTFAPIQGLRVQLPPPIAQPKYNPIITIMIDDPAPGETEGTVVLRLSDRQEIVQTREMFNWLINASDNEKIMVVIRAGNEVFHEQIVQVMDIAKQAGVDRIGFVRASHATIRIADR